ncbi:MAG: anthranilate synthase component I family protein [Phycisphaerae bacterium]|nr:anthranilate synthase component I family protein [Phycisphaerae bacterium]
MLPADRPLTARVAWRRLDLQAGPMDLLEAMAGQEDVALLESTAVHERFGRYSILACSPLEVLTLRDGRLRNARGGVWAEGDDALWAALREAFAAVEVAPGPHGCPYVPGWIGYLGYELGRHIERLPGRARRDGPLDDLRLGFFDSLAIYDALEHAWHLAELLFDDPPTGAGHAASALLDAARLAAGRPSCDDRLPPEGADPVALPKAPTRSNFTRGRYEQAVARAIDYIAAGDIFQVNLSQRLVVQPCPPALEVYRALRRRNPAWYSAYLQFPCAQRPCAIVSSSPELFLRLRDGHVTTRPIKGTRPRTGQAEADRAAAADLLASPKDNAELAMIIDLLRNDLGRVCRFGSIRVTEPRTLETHPTVFHLVGTVIGHLREGVGPAELLRATFPGGSITGAPKIRAMEIIDELEGLARGIYTGCVGIVAANGNAEWNIAIRTIVCDGSRALVQVGGGIVADSQPPAEYRETLDKARAMLEAIAQAQAAGVTP